MKTVKVQCIKCMKWVEMPKVKNVRYLTWPIIHEKCPDEVTEVWKDKYI